MYLVHFRVTKYKEYAIVDTIRGSRVLKMGVPGRYLLEALGVGREDHLLINDFDELNGWLVHLFDRIGSKRPEHYAAQAVAEFMRCQIRICMGLPFHQSVGED